MSKIVSLAGATGLIGSQLLQMLLEDEHFDKVRVLIRRPIDLAHPKLEKKIVDFGDGDSLLVALDGSQIVFCTIGTTLQKVKGDRKAYRQIDYNIAVNLSRFAKMTGCNDFVLVSSAGANPRSTNFYLKLKGEIEHEIASHKHNSVHIMRPSMLLGERKEFRPMEIMGKVMMPIFSFLLPTKYKPIKAKTVARAMLNAAKEAKKGIHIYEFGELKEIGK